MVGPGLGRVVASGRLGADMVRIVASEWAGMGGLGLSRRIVAMRWESTRHVALAG